MHVSIASSSVLATMDRIWSHIQVDFRRSGFQVQAESAGMSGDRSGPRSLRVW